MFGWKCAAGMRATTSILALCMGGHSLPCRGPRVVLCTTVLQKLRRQNERRAAASRPLLSDLLIDVLLRLLCVDVAARPGSVEEVLAHPWLAGSGEGHRVSAFDGARGSAGVPY